jgi:hypothetical protein
MVENNGVEQINNRRKILTQIEQASGNNDRALCYELIMDYSESEPRADWVEVGKTNYEVFMVSLGTVHHMIDNKNTIEQIKSYMRLMTELYGLGFSEYDSFIVFVTNDKKRALGTANIALSVLEKYISETFGFVDRNELTREICVYANGNHRPKWMDENGDNPWLEQWLMHMEEWTW